MAHYAGLGLWAQQQIMDASGGTPWVMPALYMALDKVEAGADDTGFVEVTGPNYGRPAVSLAAYSGGSRTNDVAVIFNVAGVGGWGVALAYRVMDSSTPGSGHIIFRGPCAPVEIYEGHAHIVPIGELICSLARTVS